MSYPISLVDTTSGETLVIADPIIVTPFYVQSLQVGGADVRAAVNNRPQTDGTLDVTQYSGAAAVTLNLTTIGVDAHANVDVLRAWVRPDRRSWLEVERGAWAGPRRMLVRGDALTAPVATATSDGPMVVLQMAWRAIDGVWEGVDEQSRTIFPGGVTTGGFSYPFSYPYSYGTGTPPGSGDAQVGGTVPTPPVIRIYGPATAPSLTNTVTGQTIAFTAGFTIPAGGYVSIDVAAGTVLANDDPAVTRFNSIDWTQTDLWFLQPGNNPITFTATSLGAVSQAVITWHERTA